MAQGQLPKQLDVVAARLAGADPATPLECVAVPRELATHEKSNRKHDEEAGMSLLNDWGLRLCVLTTKHLYFLKNLLLFSKEFSPVILSEKY